MYRGGDGTFGSPTEVIGFDPSRRYSIPTRGSECSPGRASRSLRHSLHLFSRPSPPSCASLHSRRIPNDREITAHLYQFTGCLFIKAHSRVPSTILPLRTSRTASLPRLSVLRFSGGLTNGRVNHKVRSNSISFTPLLLDSVDYRTIIFQVFSLSVSLLETSLI